MCGIVGALYHDPKRVCSERMIVEMRDSMAHRGPDDYGIYLDGSLGFGHRRLSIIGLTTGHQPLANEDNTLWIVFNGEIYNYKQIRKQLVQRGHIFKSESDTEVILHLYEEQGEDCVHELNGMFAFAIWDTKRKELFLARDRVGIKPLYYAPTSDAFLFSSEIKALFKSDCLVPECNTEAIPEYYLYRNVAGERSLFKGVFSLLPGHRMKVHRGQLDIQEYWSPFPEQINSSISYREAQEELTALLQDSVKIRMMSEVPLGTFCSGGIDSSLVTAIAAQQVSQPINTFSVGFHEASYDETRYAQMVSGKYATNHHEVKLNSREFADLLPTMVWHNDEPLNFANSVQIFAISKLAKEHVTVVLTGEGADELFAGYPRYQIPLLVAALRKIPQFIIPLLKIAAKLTSDHRIKKLLSFSNSTVHDAVLFNTALPHYNHAEKLFSSKEIKYLAYRLESLVKTENLNDPILQISILDQLTYLVSILYRQDKMSMAAGIESRVPFLDYRIVEFSNALPRPFKLKRGKRKRIIQDIALSFLPEEIITRKKSGFGVPLKNWINGKNGLGEMTSDLIYHNQSDILDERINLKKILNDHLDGLQDNSEILWTSINLLIWEQLFLKGQH